jgi:hypothetical protein
MDIITAIEYSYQSMTWVTWLVLFILGFRAVVSFNKAFENYTSYKEIQANNDKKALSQFYTGVIVSLLCVVVFFLPYFMGDV